MRRLLLILICGACDCGEDPQLGKVLPDLDLQSLRVDFGEVPLGATKRMALAAKNIGTADLVITAVDAPMPFGAILADTTILPGATGLIDLSFAPTNDEPQTASMIIMSNDPEGAVEVTLTGRGVEGAVAVRPTVVDLTNTAVGISRLQEIVLSNLGIGEVSGGIVTEGFTRPEHFSLSSLASFSVPGAFAIGPRSDLILDLEYRPFEIGDDNGRIVFELCGERCGIEVQVVASAAQPIVQIMPPLLDFGAVGIGETRTQQAVIQNFGARSVMLTSLATAGGSEIEAELSRSIPTELAAGESLGINVTFTPASAVEFAGEVIVNTTDPLAAQVRAAVIGRGEGPLFVVQPELLNFGTQREMIEHRRSILLINAGSSDVTVLEISIAGAPELALDEVPGLPARIGSGQSIVVDVTFTPLALGEYEGTVTITSDDPALPRAEVPVLAGLTDRLCELANNPERVNFGIIPPSFVRKKSTTLTNAGDDDCMLASGSFRAPLDPYITLVGAPFPLLLTPGQSATLDFEYAPLAAVESKANFVILTDDPVFPERHVTLLGSAQGYVDVFTEPDHLDFGSVRPGCNAGNREVRIYNAGTVGVQVDTIALTASTSEISLLATGAPYALDAGRQRAFIVGYSAANLGVDTGEVEIAIRDLPYPLVVPIRGEGAENPRVTDEFEQNTVQSVDVLFVIDDSCSMSEEQTALAQNFQQFIQQANVRDVDFHIGITTTTVYPSAGRLVGEYLTNATPSLEQTFRTQAAVGIEGSGIEQGLEAMRGAIELSFSSVAPNAGLFRPEATMVIVIVSDEEDQSVLTPVAYFNDLRTRANNGYVTAMITGGPNGCMSSSGSAVPAARYQEFAMLTGGLTESICSGWASTLANIGNAAFGLRTTFNLSQLVDQTEPIEVYVDGNLVNPSSWTYDPVNGTITFDEPPPEGSEVRIEYTPAC